MRNYVLLILALVTGSVALAQVSTYDQERRRQLRGFTASADPMETPAVVLMRPALLEPAILESEREALIDKILKFERLAAVRLGLRRVEMREAIDLVLRPEILIHRASKGQLHRHGLNRYDGRVHDAVLARLMTIRPALAQDLAEQFNSLNLLAHLHAALGLTNFGSRQLPLTIGFRDGAGGIIDFAADSWRDQRLKRLTELARLHLEARWKLAQARADVERLRPSAVRQAWLWEITTVDARLRDQLADLPARVDRLIALAREERHGSSRQNRTLDSWGKLSPEHFYIAPAEWTKLVDALELTVNADAEERAARECDAHLSR